MSNLQKRDTLLQQWETTCKLSDEEMVLINKIYNFVKERPLPPLKLEDDLKSNKDRILPEEIQSTHQFYQWFSSLEQEEFEENEALSLYLRRLSTYTQACDSLLKDIEVTQNFLQDIEKKYVMVSKKTEELHKACEGVVNEEIILDPNRVKKFKTSNFRNLNEEEKKNNYFLADNLREKLAYFEELESITKKFNSPQLSVQDPYFLPLLQRLDECIAFLMENPTYKESSTYLMKFKQLQTKGLTLVKNFIVSAFKETTTAMIASLGEQKKQETNTPISTPVIQSPPVSPSDTGSSYLPLTASGQMLSPSKVPTVNNISLYYVKIKSHASRIKPLCREIESRSSQREYQTLLSDCHYAYFQQRRVLLSNTVSKELESFSATDNIQTLLRSGCSYLINICQMEYDLYHQFFGSISYGLRMLLEGFSTTLYDNIRPMIIRCHSIDVLCSLVHILKTEILEREISKKGDSVLAFKPIVMRIVEDIQERLIFQASVLIKDDIESYSPTKEDLDYPEKIIRGKKKVLFRELDGFQLISLLAKKIQQQPNIEGQESKFQEISIETPEVDVRFVYWYPTLERTLTCLSKLYLTIDNNAFDGIAQEAMNVCTHSLVNAQKLIQTHRSPFDGQLFLIQHLLILQEEIAPFDINFLIQETVLDFSYIWNAIRALFSGKKPLFALSKDNAFYSVIAEAKPRIKNSEIDYKKDMEILLKQTKNLFITDVSNAVLKDIYSFLTQVSAVINTQNREFDPVTHLEKKLTDGSFTSLERVKPLIEKAQNNMHQVLPGIFSKLCLYLPDSKSQHELYKPIKANIIETFSRLNSILEREYRAAVDEGHLNLVDINQLVKFLDTNITEFNSTK